MRRYNLLKVSSIILIILGALTLGSVLAVALDIGRVLGLGLINSLQVYFMLLDKSNIVLLACYVLGFASGIYGVLSSRRFERGRVCVILGAVTIALFIAYLIVAIVEGFSAAYLANGIMGALFPAMYIAGGVQNMRRAKNGEQPPEEFFGNRLG